MEHVRNGSRALTIVVFYDSEDNTSVSSMSVCVRRSPARVEGFERVECVNRLGRRRVCETRGREEKKESG